MQKNYTESPIFIPKALDSEDVGLVLGDADDYAVYEMLDSEEWAPKEKTIQNILKYARDTSKV
jgi:hypothetical protein